MKWRVGLLAVASLATIATAAIRWSWTQLDRDAAPAIDIPREIDLGPRELGHLCVARLSIGNRGSAQLEIEGIRTNCSCSGLEQIAEDGTPRKLTRFSLEPGSRSRCSAALPPRAGRACHRSRWSS